MINVTEEQWSIIFKLRDFYIKRSTGKTWYDYQTKISNAIIRTVVLQTGEEITVEISRQSGKTEVIVGTVNFLKLHIKQIWKMLNVPVPLTYTVGVFAPQKEQAKTDFDRMKDGLENSAADYKIDFEENNGTTLKLNNGTGSVCFPVTTTAKIESKTVNLIVVEEKQDIPDAEFSKKVIPMGASTNSPQVSIGTAGYKICEYLRAIEKGGPNVFVFDCYEVIKQKRLAYELDKNEWHLNYEKFVTAQIEKKGLDNPEIQTQFLLKWQLEKGMWMTEGRYNKILRKDFSILRQTDQPVYVMIDVAKESDMTFVTVFVKMGYKEVIRKVPATSPDGITYYKESKVLKPEWRVINWMMVNGMLYEAQKQVIEEFLSGYTSIHKLNVDSTGNGDPIADYFISKYNGWTYDDLKDAEKDGRRGIARPVKFSPPSKHIMYTNWDAAITEERFWIPADLSSMSEQEVACFKRFKLEGLSCLREWKGNLLNVRHPSTAKGEIGDAYTDDSQDSCALLFFDEELEPQTFDYRFA